MENLSRMSSSCKQKTTLNSKQMSSYTSHTRCQSVSKPSNKLPKKIQKLHTQMISSRKYNSTYKAGQYQCFLKDPTSPYRTSFSSTKGNRKKNSCKQNIKCQSSYNLKDCSNSKQMINSSQLFNSMYVQPIDMIYYVEKDNKQSLRSTQNRKKKPSSCAKNQMTTKRSTIQNGNLILNNWERSQQNLNSIFKRSKSKQTTAAKDLKGGKIKKSRKESRNQNGNKNVQKMLICSSQALISPYSEMMNRTYDILSKYEKKMKKLYEQKISYQRMYEKSRIECENIKKSLRKKQKKYNKGQQNTLTKDEQQTWVKDTQQKDIRATKDTLKISIETFKK